MPYKIMMSVAAIVPLIFLIAFVIVPEFFILRIIKKIRLLLSPSQWAYATLIVLYINLCLFLSLN